MDEMKKLIETLERMEREERNLAEHHRVRNLHHDSRVLRTNLPLMYSHRADGISAAIKAAREVGTAS